MATGGAFHRSCGKIDIVPCQSGRVSFYREADVYEKAFHNPALHRLFTLMRKMGAKTLVKERLDGSNVELAEEIEALSAYVPACSGTASWTRLSFFSTSFATLVDIPHQPMDSILSYAIILDFEDGDGRNRCIVWESVASAPGIINNYIHCTKLFRTKVGEWEFDIQGSFFCQQNGYSNVCAHASLRMVLNNYSWPVSRRISYEEINRILGYDHKKNKTGGLNDKEVCDCLSSFTGITATTLSPSQDTKKKDALSGYVYPYIESGIPVLFVFRIPNQPESHVVPIIGHTMNTDVWMTWAYLGEYKAVNNADWIDHFIINDDNMGMYLCLPSKFLETSECYAITASPESIELQPSFAELIAKVFIEVIAPEYENASARQDYWLKELFIATESSCQAVILRTFLISRAEYITHLKGQRDWNGEGIEGAHVTILSELLPETFWMVEVTLPDLYSGNRRKLGEVLVRADRPIDESGVQQSVWDTFIAVRLCGFILHGAKGQNKLVLVKEPPLPRGHFPIYEKLDATPLTPAW